MNISWHQQRLLFSISSFSLASLIALRTSCKMPHIKFNYSPVESCFMACTSIPVAFASTTVIARQSEVFNILDDHLITEQVSINKQTSDFPCRHISGRAEAAACFWAIDCEFHFPSFGDERLSKVIKVLRSNTYWARQSKPVAVTVGKLLVDRNRSSFTLLLLNI